MDTQKINVLPLEIGDFVNPNNTLLRDVKLSLNLNKIQRDNSNGRGFNGTLQLINQLDNIANKASKNSTNNLEIRRSSILRQSHQLPSSRSQRSSSQIQLKQIPLPQSISHTPSMGHQVFSKRNRCSSNLQNNQNQNNSSSNKENIPQNSHRLSTYENSQLLEGKSLNQPLNSARTSTNLPSTSSQMSSNHNNSSISKSIIRKYSKQIKSIKDEQHYVNALYKRENDLQKQDIQLQFEKQCFNNNNYHHQSLPLQQINFEAVTNEINEYISQRQKNFIPPEDEFQKKFFDNVSLLLSMFENYSQKSFKINDHIKDVLNEVFTSLTTSQNKGQIGQMQLSQSFQKVKRCIQTISQNGLNQLFPYYNASILDIAEFQNKVLMKVFNSISLTKFDEEGEQAIVMKKAQDNRKLMDLEEKLEELKIENELLKVIDSQIKQRQLINLISYQKQKASIEGTYNKTLDKFKKENKEISRQNRELSKENMKLRQQIENLQSEIEQQSNMYNTKTNYQNMSYFDSIHNTTITDDKKTLEQNFFSGMTAVAQQMVHLNPFLIEEEQYSHPFIYKFWNQLSLFNTQYLKLDIMFTQREMIQIITDCIDAHTSSQPENNFDLITSLLAEFKLEKGSNNYTSMKKLVQFQNSYNQGNCFTQLFYLLNQVTDENASLIQSLLLLDQDHLFKRSLKLNYRQFQNAFIKIFKTLQEESSKNKIQRQDQVSLSLLIKLIKQIFNENEDQDWQWRVSLPLLLSKCQINSNGEFLNDQKQLLMYLHGFLLNRYKDDKQNNINQNEYLSLKEFCNVFMDISDICSDKIQKKFLEQIYYDLPYVTECYHQINPKQKNKKYLIKLGIEISSRLQKCTISILEASLIILSLIFQKSCNLQQSLKKVQNLFEENNRIYELNKTLKQYGITLEQYDIYDSASKIYCQSTTVKNESELLDQKMYLQKRDYSSSQAEIKVLMQYHLESIAIENFSKLIEKNQNPSTYQSVNSIKTPSLSIAHHHKYTDNDQDSILLLTQPHKLLIHHNLNKNEQ